MLEVKNKNLDYKKYWNNLTPKQKDAWLRFKRILNIKVNIYETRLVRDFFRLSPTERKVIYYYHGLDGKHRRSWQELIKLVLRHKRKSKATLNKVVNKKIKDNWNLYYTSSELEGIYIKAIGQLKTILAIKSYTDYLEEQGRLGDIVQYNFAKSNKNYEEITFSEYENNL